MNNTNIDTCDNHRLILTIIYPDKIVEKEITVNKDKKITLGASEQCDIILTDSSIAPEHFSFYYDNKPINIEKYEKNTLFKDDCFYAGLVKIKIEKYKPQDYTPVADHVFQMITDGFSLKKTMFYLFTLIFIYYFSSISDKDFFINENNSSDTQFYFTLWLMPNLLITILSVFYIVYTYFSTSKNQRAFIKIIQQHILKYSIRLSLLYFSINILLYIFNGFFDISSYYSFIMQTLLIYNLYLISKKIINLNQYKPSDKKNITKKNILYFLFLFAFTQITSFSTNYITWLPFISPISVQSNDMLEQKSQTLINSIKKMPLPPE